VSNRGDRFAADGGAFGVVAAPPRRRQPALSAPAATAVAVFATHRLQAEALASVLACADGLEVASVCSDVETLVADVAHAAPGVALLDATLDEAIAIASCLRAGARRLAVVVLTEPADPAVTEGAAAGGIEAVVPKDSPALAMVMAIHQVAAGSVVYPALRPAVVTPMRPASGLRTLSTRQREVLRLLAEGRSNTEIAAALFISVNTVKFHLRAIFRELGLRNRVQAAQRYAQLAAPTVD